MFDEEKLQISCEFFFFDPPTPVEEGRSLDFPESLF